MKKIRYIISFGFDWTLRLYGYLGFALFQVGNGD